jgi:hypothetical protein
VQNIKYEVLVLSNAVVLSLAKIGNLVECYYSDMPESFSTETMGLAAMIRF